MYGLHDGWSHPAGKKDDAPSASWRQESAERIQSVFWLGGIFNTVTLWLNKTIYKKHPLKRDYVLRFAEKERVFKDANKIIVASVSFSLLMFGIGIIITVLYLFMVR